MLLLIQSMQGDFVLSITNWSKIKMKYINFCDHQNSAIDIVADTGSAVITEMDGKPIYGTGYRPYFNRFLWNINALIRLQTLLQSLLNVQWPNEINQQLTLIEIRSYVHLEYRKRGFLKNKHSWIIPDCELKKNQNYPELLEKIKDQFNTSSNCKISSLFCNFFKTWQSFER